MIMILASLAASACVVPPAEIARQLALPYEQFDAGEQPQAWRQLNGEGCTDEAVRLLNKYADANAAKISTEQKSEIAFHRGQALAFASRNAEAIPHLEQALAIGGTDEWTTYVAANIAFLKGDAAALRKARDRYAAVAPNSMRLKFIDGFIACPTDAYMKAAFCTR